MSDLTFALTLGGQRFIAEDLVTAGRVLGVLADEAQGRAIKALRAGEFESAKDHQRIADILSGMDVEALFREQR